MDDALIRAFAKAGVKYRIHIREDVEFLDDASDAVGTDILWRLNQKKNKPPRSEFEKAARPLMEYLKNRRLQLRHFGEFTTAIVTADKAELLYNRECITGNLNYPSGYEQDRNETEDTQDEAE